LVISLGAEIYNLWHLAAPGYKMPQDYHRVGYGTTAHGMRKIDSTHKGFDLKSIEIHF
jgi:hypothetical protein